jgi:hypothetical protein
MRLLETGEEETSLIRRGRYCMMLNKKARRQRWEGTVGVSVYEETTTFIAYI